MRFFFAKPRIQRLYETLDGAEGYPRGVVDSFFKVMSVIRADSSSLDFYSLKSLHFKELKGQRLKPPLKSMRLNRQYHLELRIYENAEGKHAEIITISKHYE